MKIDLSESEVTRLAALADRLPEAEVRGVPKKDRPRVVLYRAIELGLRAMEEKLS